jgi:hypothetical protein
LFLHLIRIESVLAECDSEDDFDELMDDGKQKGPKEKGPKKKRKKMETWIQEGEVLDLTDPTSMQSISGL